MRFWWRNAHRWACRNMRRWPGWERDATGTDKAAAHGDLKSCLNVAAQQYDLNWLYKG